MNACNSGYVLSKFHVFALNTPEHEAMAGINPAKGRGWPKLTSGVFTSHTAEGAPIGRLCPLQSGEGGINPAQHAANEAPTGATKGGRGWPKLTSGDLKNRPMH